MNQNKLNQERGGLKKFLKTVGLIFGTLILFIVLAIIIVQVTRPFLYTPVKVRVILPQAEIEKESFNIYIGNIHVDGGGDYIKLKKINETTWEANAPTQGDQLGEEKDLDGLLVLKVKESDLKVPDSLVANTKISPRINGEEFQKGVEIVDYWSTGWGDKEISQTNAELKKSNVKWVYLAPVWDFKSFDPPKIENVEGGTIQYSEEQLKNHIKKLKEDGLEVIVWPQLCCTPQPDSFDKPNEWWNQFFVEYENYMLYHAKIAEETGVKVFVFSIAHQSWSFSTPTPPPNAEKRWEALYEKVRNVYKGKLALFDYAVGGELGIEVSPVFQKDVKLLEKFDFFVISLWNPLSKTDNPSQEELYQNTAKVIDNKIKYIYDKYRKPIILQTAYRSADGGNRGTEKYNVGLTDISNPVKKKDVAVEVEFGGWFKNAGTARRERPLLTYDAREQAMIYEALLRSVAERDWIVGVYPFVYHMNGFDFPRHPDYDIRRKPVETIIANWYLRF